MNHDTYEIKKQTVFLGDFPIMTPKGTFVINGTERVVVSQLVRSPGVYFSRDKDKGADQNVVIAKIIPSRGAWLEFEIDIILKMGFPGYFLIVADFIGWAKSNGVPVGPGRGSGAGSLVAYSLGITDLDPLRYDLLFERFLNPGRKSMPDIDIDFSVAGRDKSTEMRVSGMEGSVCVKDQTERNFATLASSTMV